MAHIGVLILISLCFHAVQAELIAPGKSRLSVNYKGVVSTASLGKTGNILYQGARNSVHRLTFLVSICAVNAHHRISEL